MDTTREPTLDNASSDSQSAAVVMKVDNVTKVFDSAAGRVAALRGVNLSIKRGEFVAIVGPSGSGKSTLLNIIGALDKPTAGKVYINGIDVFALADSEIATMRNHLIGFIFQSYNLINRTTVLKNVELPGILSGMAGSERQRRAEKLLEVLGIGNKAGFKPVNLSGGQQQRVAIARSLMNDPAIILADEPTGNLDTKTGNEVFDLLKMLSSKFRRTIVMVTHNPELAEACDRAIYIRDGRVEKEVVNN
ncbi:ABC efflux transporter, ATP-binding protein [Nitrososphaera viennensis EN76]|uniref:ABC efflux transporter, ATP-binding protein n=2 Tax=Nitrososphaera viennensis TaxID=1034015 RepID=A0A060HVQ3_9ARCH|nr:ABC efflux transporter, ATP-binding protein [Nitrososphaera viennensis EN76]